MTESPEEGSEARTLVLLQAPSRLGLAALERLTGETLDGIFIHLDADVLNDAVMPAVDYRIPDGLALDEVIHLLQRTLATGRVVGMEVAIYNPDRDENGAAGERLKQVLVEALGSGE